MSDVTEIPPRPDRPPLADTWNPRDFPILMEVARLSDRRENVFPEHVATTLGLTERDVISAIEALVNGGYLREDRSKLHLTGGGEVYLTFHGWVMPTEKGRRDVGLWPNHRDAQAALVELLTQAAEHTTDEDDAGALRKAARSLSAVPSSVIGGVITALIKSQTGI
jgi:hypothetical protein